MPIEIFDHFYSSREIRPSLQRQQQQQFNDMSVARADFVFDQSAHLLTFLASTNQRAPFFSTDWHDVMSIGEAVGKTSPPISLELTVVIQLLNCLLCLRQSSVNFETFCRCNF